MTMSDLGPQWLRAGFGFPARDWGRIVVVRAPDRNTGPVVIAKGPVPLALPRRISTKTEKCEANKVLTNRKKSTVHVNILLAKILAFSDSQCQIKSAEFGGNRKVALILSQWGREHNRFMPQELCPLTLTMRSLGVYIRWRLAVRSWWWGAKVLGSWFLPLSLF